MADAYNEFMNKPVRLGITDHEAMMAMGLTMKARKRRPIPHLEKLIMKH